MNLRLAIWLVGLIWGGTCGLRAQSVVPLSWRTGFAAEPISLSADLHPWLASFRLAASNLPEGSLTLLALSEPEMLGLTEKQAESMREPVRKRYKAIEADPAFRTAQPALAYCYSASKPALGLANLYSPKTISASTPCILFVHGFGGSFLWYQQFLAELFPDAIIVAPAHGISAFQMPPEYMIEAIGESEKKLGGQIDGRKWMIVGLSAGVSPAFGAFATHPERFSSMIAIAGFSQKRPSDLVAKNRNMLLFSGGNESFAQETGALSRWNAELRRDGFETTVLTLPGADHFFLLTHPEDSKRTILTWTKSVGE